MACLVLVLVNNLWHVSVHFSLEPHCPRRQYNILNTIVVSGGVVVLCCLAFCKVTQDGAHLCVGGWCIKRDKRDNNSVGSAYAALSGEFPVSSGAV